MFGNAFVIAFGGEMHLRMWVKKQDGRVFSNQVALVRSLHSNMTIGGHAINISFVVFK